MNNTRLKICNTAASLIGASAIQTLDDDSSLEAMLCEMIYDDLFETLLGYRNWTFTRVAINPALLDKQSEFGFKYVYRLPNDVISVNKVGEEYTSQVFKLTQNNELHTDLGNARVYVQVKPQEQMLPCDFVLALKYLLASELAVPIADDTAKAGYFYTKAYQQISRAADNDLTQETQQVFDNYPLINVRY